MREWLVGWYHTLRIKFHEPELYRMLTDICSDWTDTDLIDTEPKDIP